VGPQWAALVAEREARLTAALDTRMDLVLRSGRAAAEQAAASAAAPSAGGLMADLAAVQERTGVAAVAVVDSAGQLVAWAGEHRGQVPEEVRAAGPPIVYVERPLFSYIYFTAASAARRERSVAAVLLQTGLPMREPAADAFADRFWAGQHARPVFGPGGAPGAAWTLKGQGGAIAHASFERLTQAEWRDALSTRGRRAALLTVALGLLLLSLSWLRRPQGRVGARSAVPLALLALAAGLAPIGRVLEVPRLFSPGFFMLPYLPIVVSLGALLGVLIPLGALVASMHVPRLGRVARGWALPASMLLVAAGFAGGLQLFFSAASPPLLEGGSALWGGFQLAAVLLLSAVAAAAFPHVAGWPGRASPELHGGIRHGFVVGGVVLSVVLALLVLARWTGQQQISVWPAAVWALPFGLMAIGLSAGGRPPRLGRWLAAGWLAASVVLPYVWVSHVQARLQAAERQVATLGNRPDPFLDFLLRRFGAEVQLRNARGEQGLELLYRSWVASGFAEETYPARIELWERDSSTIGFGGVAEASSDTVNTFVASLVARARAAGQPIVEAVRNVPDVNQAMAVPLDGGRAVSLVVPPRRELVRPAALAPFLGRENAEDTRLELVPVKPGLPGPPSELQWQPNDEGWRGEVLAHYPDRDYHAHIQVVLPAPGVRLARAALLAALDLAILLLLWVLGRIGRGDMLVPPGGWPAVLRGFRARVTAALFLFFLLPTVAFGLVAYRALAGEVVRSASIVARNAVAQAAREFDIAMGDLRALSLHTGQDLLYYQGGELLEASNHDAMELGVYDAWMPPSVYLALQSGEQLDAVEPQQVAEQAYLVAYERLPVVATLAVPVPLAAGDTGVRQHELAHLILFAVLLGVLFTLGLSLAVGRALATPIGQLSRAAALVGGGRLRVQLPEDRRDEFGRLFASFNRMARRLRRARAQQVRTARVLAWGEMARQVAHEIKNPLTPIKLSVQHIRRAHADGRADFPQILQVNGDQILAEIDRLTEIARAFSRYGAPSDAAGPLEPVDVGAVVRDALTLYRAGDATVNYVDALDAPLPRGMARTGELKEVMLNLVENARAALDGRRGSITVSGRSEDGWIDLVVRDDGPGIPAGLLHRIFEPHFSTRSTGTGLGLAIVRRLVESWGGQVTAESEEGAGTEVRVRIAVAVTSNPAAG
jgi:signal transduction histidine kinase